MVNPLLTVIFDLFLLGSAVAVVAAMVQEYFDSRAPSVGGAQSPGRNQRERPRDATPMSKVRRRQLKRVA